MPAAVETMAYAGETPWHRLGTKVDKNITSDEMVVAAGIDWEVALADVMFNDGVIDSTMGTWRWNAAPGFKVLYRKDTHKVFDVVGPDYQPVQNRDVVKFFDEYLKAGEMTIETAGSLWDGKYIWCLAKMGANFTLAGGDKVTGYVFLANPHIYGKGMIAKITLVRVVCWNTFTAALAGDGLSVKIWHNKEFTEAVQQDAKRKLGIARERFDAYKQDCEALTELKLTHEQAVKVVAVAMNSNKPDEPLKEQPRGVKRVIELFEGAGIGMDLKSAQDTGWGLLNATTQYIDHEYGRGGRAQQSKRFQNAVLGGGEVTKRRVFSELLLLTEGAAQRVSAGKQRTNVEVKV